MTTKKTPTGATEDAPEAETAPDTAPAPSGSPEPRETAPEGRGKRPDPEPRFCANCGGPLTRYETTVDGGYDLLTGEKKPDTLRIVVQCGRLFHTQLELRPDGSWQKPL